MRLWLRTRYFAISTPERVLHNGFRSSTRILWVHYINNNYYVFVRNINMLLANGVSALVVTRFLYINHRMPRRANNKFECLRNGFWVRGVRRAISVVVLLENVGEKKKVRKKFCFSVKQDYNVTRNDNEINEKSRCAHACGATPFFFVERRPQE